MSSTQTTKLISVQDYLRIESKSGERYEFYDGKIKLMPGGTIPHNTIAANIFGELFAISKARGNLRVFGSDQKIYLPKYNFYLYADTVVVSQEPIQTDDEADAIINPILIVEVMSPSSEHRDSGAKFIEYSSLQSLKEYVLIRQDAPSAQSFYREKPGTWHDSVVEGLNKAILLKSIDVRLELSDIYRKVF
jgi:Uma2 family endonuclease